MTKRTTHLVIEGSAIALAMLFFTVGLSKLLGFHDFQSSLKASPWVKHFVWPVSLLLPLTEIGLAVLLLLSKTQRAALLSSAVLMAIFTLYNIYIVSFAGHIPCSCGAIFQYISWRNHLIINGLFLSVAIIAYILYIRSKSRKTSPIH